MGLLLQKGESSSGRFPCLHQRRKQVVSFEELLLSRVVYTEALTRLLVEKGVITKEEFVEMVKVIIDNSC